MSVSDSGEGRQGLVKREADLWLVLGSGLSQRPITRRITDALALEFGDRFAVVRSNELVMGAGRGGLSLRGLDGRELAPPKVAYGRVWTPGANADREVALLRHLEAMGSVLLNPADAVQACLDKFRQMQRLAMAGLAVPETRMGAGASLAEVSRAGVYGTEGDGSEGDGPEGDGSEGDGPEGDGSEGDGSGTRADGVGASGTGAAGLRGAGASGAGVSGAGAGGAGAYGSEGDGTGGDGTGGSGAGGSDAGAGGGGVGIGWPCVVKAVRGHRGEQVFLAPDDAALRAVRSGLGEDTACLFQEYIAYSHGRDLRVVVIDGRPAGAGVRTATGGDFRSNLALGGTLAPCTGRHPEAEALAVRAADVMGLSVAGVDLLFTPGGGFTVCEVNANVGWQREMKEITPALVAAFRARLTDTKGPPPSSRRPEESTRASLTPREPLAAEPVAVEPPTVEPPTVEPPTVEPPTVEPPTAEPLVTEALAASAQPQLPAVRPGPDGIQHRNLDAESGPGPAGPGAVAR
ncbi:hypothetical protein ACGFW5_24250 [Streptomyces sp. NPDC048416]|uniref:hypothetical protein n=1 Tax=Streptomyces sp. NPDC048416 TaxID=3365546 RepID=UPI003712450C